LDAEKCRLKDKQEARFFKTLLPRFFEREKEIFFSLSKLIEREKEEAEER
jgi:hypothetical protein